MGEQHVLPNPSEQPHIVELRLERANVLADRRLRHMQSLGRRAVVAGLDHSQEGLQVNRIEHSQLRVTDPCISTESLCLERSGGAAGAAYHPRTPPQYAKSRHDSLRVTSTSLALSTLNA